MNSQQSQLDIICLSMFEQIKLHNQLHFIKNPEPQDCIFFVDSCYVPQNEAQHENDDSKSEGAESTHQNQPFSKIEQKTTKSPKNKSGKKLPCIEKDSQTQKIQKIKKENKSKVIPKKDYKKNICGYITKRGVKQALDRQYRSEISQLCQKFDVDIQRFYKVYNTHNSENITGPTHFCNLVYPKLDYENSADNMKELSIRMVFIIFFQWFIRNRYIRYLMHDGKMTEKDKYINYKNREFLFLIASEWQGILQNVQIKLKDGVSIVQELKEQIQRKYKELIQKNRVEINESQKMLQQKSLPKQKHIRMVVQNPQNEQQIQNKVYYQRKQIVEFGIYMDLQ